MTKLWSAVNERNSCWKDIVVIHLLYSHSIQVNEGSSCWKDKLKHNQFFGGGEMIPDVFFDHSTYAEPPSRFEAGTPANGEAVDLGAAIDYISGISGQKIHDYEVKAMAGRCPWL